MKRIVLGFACVGVLVYANEVERINRLVDEVKQLRLNCDACEEKLLHCENGKEMEKDESFSKDCEVTLQDEKEKSEILLREIDANARKEHHYETHIKDLQIELSHAQAALAEQSKENEKLKKQLKQLQKQLQEIKHAHTQKKPKTQLPPKELVVTLKDEKVRLALDEQGRVVVKKRSDIVITKPKIFRTKRDAKIYNAINGKIVTRWEKGTSFTSYIESGEWIKITGYFVDKKWTKATRELWIKKVDAKER